MYNPLLPLLLLVRGDNDNTQYQFCRMITMMMMRMMNIEKPKGSPFLFLAD